MTATPVTAPLHGHLARPAGRPREGHRPRRVRRGARVRRRPHRRGPPWWPGSSPRRRPRPRGAGRRPRRAGPHGRPPRARPHLRAATGADRRRRAGRAAGRRDPLPGPDRRPRAGRDGRGGPRGRPAGPGPPGARGRTGDDGRRRGLRPRGRQRGPRARHRRRRPRRRAGPRGRGRRRDLLHAPRVQQPDGAPRGDRALRRRATVAVGLHAGRARGRLDPRPDARPRRLRDPRAGAVRRGRVRLEGPAARPRGGRGPGRDRGRGTPGAARRHASADVRAHRLPDADDLPPPARRGARRHAGRRRPRRPQPDLALEGVRRADRDRGPHDVRRAPPPHDAPRRAARRRRARLDARPRRDARDVRARGRDGRARRRLRRRPGRAAVRNEPDVDPETGNPFNNRRLVECLERGAARFGWADRDPAPGTRLVGDWWVGTGVAASTYRRCSCRATPPASGRSARAATPWPSVPSTSAPARAPC